jgi:hypothetical protein
MLIIAAVCMSISRRELNEMRESSLRIIQDDSLALPAKKAAVKTKKK